MIACLCQAMSLDQDEETIYADFSADVYNDLIEYQFNNIVKLMSGLEMGESIQEKVLKELSANLAALMVVENWKDEASWCDYPTNSSQSDTLQVKFPILEVWPKWWPLGFQQLNYQRILFFRITETVYDYR